MSGNSPLLLAMIRECIRTGRFVFSAHALTKHTASEGFTPRQAIEAIMAGDIIEHYEARNSCLIAGSASGLVVSNDYIATYIHCVCAYDQVNRIVIVTMYRPRSTEWINPSRRKPHTEGE